MSLGLPCMRVYTDGHRFHNQFPYTYNNNNNNTYNTLARRRLPTARSPVAPPPKPTPRRRRRRRPPPIAPPAVRRRCDFLLRHGRAPLVPYAPPGLTAAATRAFTGRAAPRVRL